MCVSLDVNFNESLTNDIVSFEQLGPDLLNVQDDCKALFFACIWHKGPVHALYIILHS